MAHSSRWSIVPALVLGALAVGAVGCGDYESAADWTPLDAIPVPEPPKPGPKPRPEHCSDVRSPGPAPIRLLTNSEYDNTVRDLTGTSQRFAGIFPPEERVLGFDNNAGGRSVTQIHIERYMEAAEKLVAEMLRDRREDVIQCDPEDVGATFCAEKTLARFAELAYRRKLEPDEVVGFREAYLELAEEYDFDTTMGIIMEVILQSPQFLYRLEQGAPDGDDDGVSKLTGYEIAVRMSYLLWNSTPDDYLLGAAEIGKLDSLEGIADEARRLLRHERARDTIRHFHRQWLELSHITEVFKDPERYDGFTSDIKKLLAEETEAFVEHVIFEGDGDLRALLSAPTTMLNSQLADFYGFDTPTSQRLAAQVLTPTDLDPTQRAGFLTHASLLSIQSKFDQTSPVLRGKFVREKLLCTPLDPPPNDVDITPPEVDPTLTTRERFAAHREQEICAVCHTLMDPLGFAFEHYDAVGRWRTHEEGGQPVDAAGEVTATRDSNGEFYGAVELAQRLAESAQAHQCYIIQWFRYTHGRDASYKGTGTDACTIWDLEAAFSKANLDVKELLVALTQTDAFRYRPTITPSGTPVEEEIIEGNPEVEPDDGGGE